MEMQSLLKNGVLRLPPGFRFKPTDEELVAQYLNRKALSRPLPALIIPEFDVCKSDPWDLPGNSEKEMYFFSTREAKYPNGNRSNRATCSGYWKATGIDKRISAAASRTGGEVVGMKKTLVFYRGKPPNGARTDWIMHEYRLDSVKSSGETQMTTKNWVLCRIFLKKRGNKNGEEQSKSLASKNNGVGAVYYDFVKGRTDLNVAPAASSPESSGVTEVSGNESDHEESSSSRSLTSLKRKQ